jgi:broad specificity phosphatase PhoE
MKILFIRHAESQDDLENKYGGWADFPLTENGRSTIKQKSAIFQTLHETEHFETVYSSPLKRAFQSAEIVAEALKLPLEIFEFLKERNKYGILSGMNKDEAHQKYPEMVLGIDKDEYVFGAERRHDVMARIQKCLELLQQKNHKSVIAVTHGGFLMYMLKQYCNMEIKKVTDGGYVLVEIEDNAVKILKSDGLILA